MKNVENIVELTRLKEICVHVSFDMAKNLTVLATSKMKSIDKCVKPMLVAAMEINLFSVTPEICFSRCKLHTDRKD